VTEPTIGQADIPGRISAAQTDLARLREVLEAAAEGEVEPEDLMASLQGYWRGHKSLLRWMVSSVVDLARLQALEELYKWRRQLDAQLQLIDEARRNESSGSRSFAESRPGHSTEPRP
jgi:hypothetical protein